MAQNSPDDMKIADQYTVADWKAMKSMLVPGQPDNWKNAFKLFFRKRIETRYFEPIKLLQKHGDNKGEGFSIVALQCSLIEFLASTRTGQKYKHCKPNQDECNEYEYCQSSKIFIDFLTFQAPFNAFFAAKPKQTNFMKMRVAHSFMRPAPQETGKFTRIVPKTKIELSMWMKKPVKKFCIGIICKKLSRYMSITTATN